MSPIAHVKRDDCDLLGNNCRTGVRPTTYATAIALIILFILFVSCFVLRRRRHQRNRAFHSQSIHIAPLTPHPQHNLHSSYQPSYQPPPPMFFEPAPPYDPTKPPPAPHSPPPPPPQSPRPEPSSPPPGMPQAAIPPVQYPPPSYTPA